MKSTKKHYLRRFLKLRPLTLVEAACLMALLPLPVQADCVDLATGASATGGSTCSATQTDYSNSAGSALVANGTGNVLNVSNASSINAVSPGWGSAASAVRALSGGVVNITGGPLNVTTSGWVSPGLYAGGTGSKIDVDISGPLTIKTAGGSGDASAGLFADPGGQITVKGAVDIATGVNANGTPSGTTGRYQYGIYSNGTGAQVNVGNATIKSGYGGEGSGGMGAYRGGSITAGIVDIAINANSQYSYGVLADGATSSVTFAGGRITEKDLLNPKLPIFGGQNTSNSAVRATAGTVTVTGALDVTTEGFGARGIYASEGGTINLQGDTTVTILKGSKGWLSSGIQIGKSRPSASGDGVVNAYGKLTINQQLADGSSAIYIEGASSALNADFANSSTTIVSAGPAITFGASNTATDHATTATISLNNANLSTTHATYDLIRVGGRVEQGSALNLTNGSATAGADGWLISVTNKPYLDTILTTGSTTYASDFAFNAENMKLQGSVSTVAGSQLHMKLDNGSVWTLAPKASTTTSTFTDLALNNSTLDASGDDFTVVGKVNSNGGTIDLSGASPSVGQTLRIRGDYVGNGGKLKLDTVLEGDGAPSDLLLFDGGHASGATSVFVNNIGGLGAQTTGDGIHVIGTENGGTTAAGAFSLGQRVAAGLYEYSLVRGGSATPEDWYLTSEYTPLPPPVNPPSPDYDGGGDTPTPPPVLPNIRPEVPVYMAAPLLANRLGLATLGTYHDRVGEDDFAPFGQAPASNGDKPKVGWARVFGESGSLSYGGSGDLGRLSQFRSKGPSYDYDFAGLQAGMDIYRKMRSENVGDVAGAYIGYGRIDGDVQAVYGGKAGTMEMNGYSIGGYWTRKSTSGWYLDAVAQGTWFDNVQGTSVLGQRMDTNGWGFTGSLEGGYPFALGSGWAIEPQAQLVYQHVSIDDSQDAYGKVLYDSTDTVYGRIGARLTKQWQAQDGRRVTAWARANLWHAFGGDAKTTFTNVHGFNAETVGAQLGGATWAQVGLGVSGQVTRNTSLFVSGDYNKPVGSGSGHAWGGRVGVKVVW